MTPGGYWWLTRQVIAALHDESVDRFGGTAGIRDEGLLASALARPANVAAYDPQADIFDLAAALCGAIVRNHPFVDGNKRAGILAAHVFLAMNGQTFRPLEVDIVTRLVATAAKQVTEADLAAWLRSASRPET